VAIAARKPDICAERRPLVLFHLAGDNPAAAVRRVIWR
jgi:hypothetical protein